MFAQGLVYAALVAAGLIGASTAQQFDDRQTNEGIESSSLQPIAGSTNVAFAGSQSVRANPPNAALLSEIAHWLNENLNLAGSVRHPRVEIVPVKQILFLRYRAFTADKQSEILAAYEKGHGRPVAAVYNPHTATISLAEGWTGGTTAEISILVHEMVHHLQHQARLSYACPEESEKLAYAAQEKWLAQSGLTLESEFGLDPFTLLATSLCPY